MRFPWQIDAVVIAATLIALVLISGCCTARPAAVGFLEGMGAIEATSARKWQSEIESQCGGGPVSAEPSAPSRSWWERFWDE